MQRDQREGIFEVFRHLISNAVRDNHKSNPEVTIDVEVDDSVVNVRVADNGPGIPDSQKDEIFGRGEMGLQSPGSGIGLYLVDTLVEMYGGEVYVTDRAVLPSEDPLVATADVGGRDDGEPDGSVFVVSLPRS